MSRYIYRYKYLPDMVGIKGVVQGGTIKFTHPSAFNDPFDCMPSSKFGTFTNLKHLNPRLYDAWSAQSGSPAQRLMGMEQSKRILRAKIESGELLQRLLEQASVLSLSKIPDSILMWSHYADFHRGAVVEFKIPISNRLIRLSEAYRDLVAFDVDYTDSRPTLEYNGAVVDGSEILRQLFLAKSQHWAYEQESRVIKRLGGSGIFDYNHDLLHSVIVGAKSSSYYEIKDCVTAASVSLGKKVEIFKAKFDPSSYAIKIPGFHKKKDIPQLVG
ncbi:DUF2971 domain-containing protein [Pseudomonas sp. A34-9]|uniref:DUF2971 domain-containing protein n=1 Tax=Pseudomonas sp. A34-9 TaxID=3034675 RepID=UPI00240D9FAD|nr:DUF2971 domain-containing protein [Pseudomonas sp. A34-9]